MVVVLVNDDGCGECSKDIEREKKMGVGGHSGSGCG